MRDDRVNQLVIFFSRECDSEMGERFDADDDCRFIHCHYLPPLSRDQVVLACYGNLQSRPTVTKLLLIMPDWWDEVELDIGRPEIKIHVTTHSEERA